MARRRYVPGVSATQVPLSGMAAALIGLAAFGTIAFQASWLVVRHINVMAHEGAHAVTASLLFREVDSIKLNADATGATSRSDGSTPVNIVIKFIGYVGPSLYGLGAAKLIESGHIAAVLWIALFLLAVLLLQLRMSFGIVTVILAGALVFLVLRYTPARDQVLAAYAIAWLLLLSGVRMVLEHGSGAGDAQDLRGLTHLPRFLWFLLWLAATLTAVAAGGKWLVMQS
jgi:hypothetical protein